MTFKSELSEENTASKIGGVKGGGAIDQDNIAHGSPLSGPVGEISSLVTRSIDLRFANRLKNRLRKL